MSFHFSQSKSMYIAQNKMLRPCAFILNHNTLIFKNIYSWHNTSNTFDLGRR